MDVIIYKFLLNDFELILKGGVEVNGKVLKGFWLLYYVVFVNLKEFVSFFI